MIQQLDALKKNIIQEVEFEKNLIQKKLQALDKIILIVDILNIILLISVFGYIIVFIVQSITETGEAIDQVAQDTNTELIKLENKSNDEMGMLIKSLNIVLSKFVNQVDTIKDSLRNNDKASEQLQVIGKKTNDLSMSITFLH